MTGPRLVAEVRALLGAAADPAYRVQLARLVPDVRAIGVRVPAIRALAAGFVRAHPALDGDGWCALLDALCASRGREEILFGVFGLARRVRTPRQIAWSRIRAWARAADNWEVCDQLAMVLAAPRVAAERALVDDLVQIARDPDRWQRRFAVATMAVLDPGDGHSADVLRVCEEVIGDADPMVRKAVAWAIRALRAQDPAGAARYVERQAALGAPKATSPSRGRRRGT